ncbi:MAG TPA: zinc-ribbon domain-containing protein [bacterium]|nr:zinc-ribbon domain-containing protein [bacterium]
MTKVNIEDLEDKTLYCIDCGDKFIWTAGEQKFFLEKGLQNLPKRCKICTAKNKSKLREKHPMWWLKCRRCGKRNEVPFEPISNDALCEDCFKREVEKRNVKIQAMGETVPEPPKFQE